MMVDILCALLVGGHISKDIRPMYALPFDDSKRYIGHFFMAINIESFCPLGTFRQTLQQMVDRVRDLPPIAGEAGVLIPGDPEKRCFAQRSHTGIPLDELKFSEFTAVSSVFDEVCRK
jgi:LDH2 family malate/lactate/ureidoglycolate dehydrogenase